MRTYKTAAHQSALKKNNPLLAACFGRRGFNAIHHNRTAFQGGATGRSKQTFPMVSRDEAIS